ncbi:Kdo hydroxylase family protein [Piscinibacter sp. XHJ-5]|uniref:Kdo hydroxylase family protein n=1 Tax=Piscinibacter sp. XHJ-5 TaxID=3037797 RepID=UPI0024534A93|nr:Kdo hydroxylase family protein [Piscinibacter sp. XHJ-5]
MFAKPDGWSESHQTSGADWPAASVTPVHRFADTQWDAGPTSGVEELLEDGALLGFASLPFTLAESEARRLLDGPAPAALLARYAEHSEALALRLFPHYRGCLRRGPVSLRSCGVTAGEASWRRDDTRLHVAADPARPTRGTRQLLVCCNLDPAGGTHAWRVGEPFAAHARRYLASLTRPLPGSAALLRALAVTRGRRTEFDHLMLQLHDHAKADLDFQRNSPQAEVVFPAGSTWIVYGDQVPHAAMTGRHLIEQTFHLRVDDMQRPETAPLRTLERLLHRPLG